MVRCEQDLRLYERRPRQRTLESYEQKALMRVLQVAPPWFPVPPTRYGGIEQIVALLADGLAVRGHDVTLHAAWGSHTHAQHLWIPTPPVDSTLLGDPAVEIAHLIGAYARRSEFDIIHDHTLIGTAMGAVPGGPPVVHTQHGPWTPTATTAYAKLAGRVHLVAVSHDQADRAPSNVQLTDIIHNAIDMSSYPIHVDKGEHLVFVGRACPDKGPEVAIEVARRLERPLRMAVKVNEPDERAYFDEVIQPLLTTADVELVDIADHDDKTRLLGEGAAALFPIDWSEPFGLVQIEANACGTPVVAFAQGAAPEVVADGTSGILVSPGDVDGFCDAVELAVELDPSACRQHVEKNFDAPIMVERYEGLYRRIITDSTVTLTLADPGADPAHMWRPTSPHPRELAAASHGAGTARSGRTSGHRPRPT
jgi:glycosyltransferase involved in cell wall biosynthesis